MPGVNHPARKLRRLHRQQDGKCYFCGCETKLRTPNMIKNQIMFPDSATIEHLIPRIKGGSNRLPNLKMSCHHCNSMRRDMDAIKWMRIVRTEESYQYWIQHVRKKPKAEIRREKAKIRKEKRIAEMLKEFGIAWEIIKIPAEEFYRLFEKYVDAE